MFFLFPRLEHPAGWIRARYKSLLLLLLVCTVWGIPGALWLAKSNGTFIAVPTMCQTED